MILSICILRHEEDPQLLLDLLESFQYQDLDDVEIIILDGSRYATIIPNDEFWYVRTITNGTNEARKYVYEKTKGDFIWFFDCDDTLADFSAIENIKKACEKAKAENRYLIELSYYQECRITDKLKIFKKAHFGNPLFVRYVYSRQMLEAFDTLVFKYIDFDDMNPIIDVFVECAYRVEEPIFIRNSNYKPVETTNILDKFNDYFSAICVGYEEYLFKDKLNVKEKILSKLLNYYKLYNIDKKKIAFNKSVISNEFELLI